LLHAVERRTRAIVHKPLHETTTVLAQSIFGNLEKHGHNKRQHIVVEIKSGAVWTAVGTGLVAAGPARTQHALGCVGVARRRRLAKPPLFLAYRPLRRRGTHYTATTAATVVALTTIEGQGRQTCPPLLESACVVVTMARSSALTGSRSAPAGRRGAGGASQTELNSVECAERRRSHSPHRKKQPGSSFR
jgi:hypothetical protein